MREMCDCILGSAVKLLMATERIKVCAVYYSTMISLSPGTVGGVAHAWLLSKQKIMLGC